MAVQFEQAYVKGMVQDGREIDRLGWRVSPEFQEGRPPVGFQRIQGFQRVTDGCRQAATQ